MTAPAEPNNSYMGPAGCGETERCNADSGPQPLRELLPDVLDQLAETAAARRVHPHHTTAAPSEENDHG